MISSRRLAREWALKILYQWDVGKTSVEEALEGALERLRLEFVQRGSRTASGSTAEQISLNHMTYTLRNALPGMTRPLERAVVGTAERVFDEAPYWQEIRLERSFRTQAPGVSLQPPRLLTPLPNIHFLPADVRETISQSDCALILAFVAEVREALPRLLETEMKLNARQFAKDLATNRPLGVPYDVVQQYLNSRREEHNVAQAVRWRKVGEIVQKQMADWLRTATFAVHLVNGAYQKRGEIDEAIVSLSSGWRLERQVAVDRNILRLAGYEMFFLSTVPTGASINEAVELAKKYSTAESGRFVNGVLGALAARIGEKKVVVEEVDDIEDELDEPIDLSDIAAIDES